MDETRRVTEVQTHTSQRVAGDHPQKAYTQKKAIFRAYQVIWYILGVIEVLLGFRFILKALAANPASGFTSLIYGLSNIFVAPFRGIFPTNVVSGSVFEWSTLIAAVVYMVVAYGLVYMFQIVKPTDPQEVETKTREV